MILYKLIRILEYFYIVSLLPNPLVMYHTVVPLKLSIKLPLFNPKIQFI